MYVHAYISLIACKATDGCMVVPGTLFAKDCNKWLVCICIATCLMLWSYSNLQCMCVCIRAYV